MINRVLIRIKVVQLLYSYLLSGHNFTLESAPESPTRVSRFAYGLYLDTLYLFIKIAESISKRGGDKPLMRNRLIRIISADEKMRSYAARIKSTGYPLKVAVDAVTAEVKNSAIYKKYIKNGETSLAEDVKFWSELLEHVISRNEEYNAVISSLEGYSLRGAERAKAMVEDTFTKLLSSQIPLSDARNQLAQSMDKARELYVRLMALPVELINLRDRQIDSNRHKLLPAPEDLNPNLKFVENRLSAALAGNADLKGELDSRKISWLQEEPVMMNKLLEDVMSSDIYQAYMSRPTSTFKEDVELWRDLFKDVILPSDTFLEYMEDKSIFWNDDLEIISTFVLKSFRKLEESVSSDAFLPMFKDEEDSHFGDLLFESVARNRAEYMLMLDECIRKDSWDTDRLAYMDTVIILTAIAEILNFPKIPVKVSINEYIELAKSYSTSKSGVFVNGILATIVARMREKGDIVKA